MKGRLWHHTEWVELDEHTVELGGSWAQGRTAVEAYGPAELRFFYQRLCQVRHPFFLDIGASTGSYCLLTGLVPGSTCVAFEPNPAAFEVLQQNIALNNLQELVEPVALALGREAHIGTLHVPKQSGLATLGRMARADEWEDVTVPVIPLDTYDQWPPVDFMKIDVEGGELDVLYGGEGLIRTDMPGILIEIYGGNTAQFGYNAHDIRTLLIEWGYAEYKVGAMDSYFWYHKEHQCV